MTAMKITETTPIFSFVAAVFIFGDYPQVPWDEAAKRLELKITTFTRQKEVSPTALFVLGRRKFGRDFKFL